MTTQHPRPDILTHDGTYFNLLDPDPATITIESIAHALSHLCRFSGHVRTFYSVAQHSVMVSHIVPQKLAMTGLLHDAAEAYLGDITSPLKQFLPEYRTFEHRVEQAIFDRFNITYPAPPEVKHADLVALATERRDLMPSHDDEWAILSGINPLPNRIRPMSINKARKSFLLRYHEIRHDNSTDVSHG